MGNWIPVTENLPKEGEMVLVTCKTKKGTKKRKPGLPFRRLLAWFRIYVRRNRMDAAPTAV